MTSFYIIVSHKLFKHNTVLILKKDKNYDKISDTKFRVKEVFAMVTFLRTILAVLTSLACFLSSPIFGNFKEGYTPDEDCKAYFAVISDVHLVEGSYDRQKTLEMGLADMQSAETSLDALIFAGDTTNMANLSEYEMLAQALGKYTPANNIIMATGNHDLWNEEVDDDDRFPESERLFIEYNKKLTNRDIEKVYYSTEVNGYTFIVLGSENDITRGYITDEQLQWLDAEMAKAAKKGLPIFVISHWVLDDTHGQPDVWTGPFVPDEEKEEENESGYANGKGKDVQAILEKYDDVFMISGHLHNGIAHHYTMFGCDYSSIEDVGSIHSVNLPTYASMAIRGNPSNGMGFVFEVYDDEVVIKARCFSAGVWYTNYFYTFPLTK